ncbi:MAG: 2-keto-4-pentenoate hydratase [Alphaproteobacteria bacterium HGW-Alphaproteobacteria-18]|nr:MAG: 2-keto-4-pentenoate hydratase [Alphaproteobacteria bacterium HGW-Alphaproteobacteria-18]
METKQTDPPGANALQQTERASGMAQGNTTEVSNLATADARADAFVSARLLAQPLPVYPGTMPATLAEAYAIQNRAIQLWPDRLAGWKVGRINPPWDGVFGTDRLAGPIFASQVSRATGDPVDCFIFQGGFGAVESEIVIVAGNDAPPEKLRWSLQDAADMAGSMHIGAEIASSCFPGINDHGPLVTISDFGNNNGLILGEEIPGWRAAAPTDWRLRTLIDGREAGYADATTIPGGPMESFRQLLEITAARGLPLRKGTLVSTGAVTGVHAAQAGQTATVEYAGLQTIHLRLLSAHPFNQTDNPPSS